MCVGLQVSCGSCVARSPDGLLLRARLQSLHQVAHLAHVVVQMGRADQEQPRRVWMGGWS